MTRKLWKEVSGIIRGYVKPIVKNQVIPEIMSGVDYWAGELTGKITYGIAEDDDALVEALQMFEKAVLKEITIQLPDKLKKLQ